jgi:catechol 2,3-dioxygenase-like lactoylglutathione lyase family enzyme
MLKTVKLPDVEGAVHLSSKMTLDHIMVKVKDWPKAKAYYTSALKPLGYTPIVDFGTGGGFGVPGEKMGNIYIKQGAPL